MALKGERGKSAFGRDSRQTDQVKGKRFNM